MSVSTISYGKTKPSGFSRAGPRFGAVRVGGGGGGIRVSRGKLSHSPAPVTRATFPSKEADARPRGPGMALYLPGSLMTAGMLAVFGALFELGERVYESWRRLGCRCRLMLSIGSDPGLQSRFQDEAARFIYTVHISHVFHTVDRAGKHLRRPLRTWSAVRTPPRRTSGKL